MEDYLFKRRQEDSVKPIKKLSILLSSSAVALLIPSVAATAYAATTKAAPGQVRAEVNGKSIPAIAVGNETYLEWQALKSFQTPYEYLGDGKFAITGGTVQGVVYQGNTYLPWAKVGAKIKATKLKGAALILRLSLFRTITKSTWTSSPRPLAARRQLTCWLATMTNPFRISSSLCR